MKVCAWCPRRIQDAKGLGPQYRNTKFCSNRCRQAHFKASKLSLPAAGDGSSCLLWPGETARARGDASTALKRAYADPPYPNRAFIYKDQPDYKGEVDHAALIEKLKKYDGWALSTSRHALQEVLALCPKGVYVCPWTHTRNQKARGPANVCEFVIVSPARLLMPGPLDSFVGPGARGGDSNLKGRKPLKFVFWVFRLLGAGKKDELEDLFPGSGMVGRCWRTWRLSCSKDTSPVDQRLQGVGDRQVTA